MEDTKHNSPCDVNKPNGLIWKVYEQKDIIEGCYSPLPFLPLPLTSRRSRCVRDQIKQSILIPDLRELGRIPNKISLKPRIELHRKKQNTFSTKRLFEEFEDEQVYSTQTKRSRCDIKPRVHMYFQDESYQESSFHTPKSKRGERSAFVN
uniref:Uncharacterized protein n=1 Tax=Proboscia inermis TaxID=420281 RepID=A0A7S0CL34_9STRA